MIAFSDTLKKLRISHGLTQKEVSDIIGVDRSTYAYYEIGTTKPDFECIIKLCSLYGMKVDEVVDLLLQDNKTQITFKTIDNETIDKQAFLNDLDRLNVDEYEKLILYFYRHLPEEYKKLFFVKIKQSFDEISNLEVEEQ